MTIHTLDVPQTADYMHSPRETGLMPDDGHELRTFYVLSAIGLIYTIRSIWVFKSKRSLKIDDRRTKWCLSSWLYRGHAIRDKKLGYYLLLSSEWWWLLAGWRWWCRPSNCCHWWWDHQWLPGDAHSYYGEVRGEGKATSGEARQSEGNSPAQSRLYSRFQIQIER